MPSAAISYRQQTCSHRVSSNVFIRNPQATAASEFTTAYSLQRAKRISLKQSNPQSSSKDNTTNKMKYKILITGAAGFIGSNLVEHFLNQGHVVRALDNFATGFRHNIEPFLAQENFEFIEGDIRELDTCMNACEGMDYVLHQAALGSVPRSIKDPITTNEVNSSGFLNMLIAVRDQNVKRFVYAANVLANALLRDQRKWAEKVT